RPARTPRAYAAHAPPISAALFSPDRLRSRFLAISGVKLIPKRNHLRPKLTYPIRRVHIVQMAARLLPGPFTVEMYHKLGELGVFNEDDRVELLDGQIVEMTPIGQAHSM